jgi:hypothetical protein
LDHPFDEDDHPFGGDSAEAGVSTPQVEGGFAGASYAALPGDKAVGRLSGMEGFDFLLAGKQKALLWKSFGTKLSDAAKREPDRMVDFANLLRSLSPAVAKGELWSENLIRQLSGVCMCLGRAGMASSQGLPYRPEWTAVANSWRLGAKERTYEAALRDPREDAALVASIERRDEIEFEACSRTGLGEQASVEDWMEWRGFQKLAAQGARREGDSGSSAVLSWAAKYEIGGELLAPYTSYGMIKPSDAERLEVVFETLALRRESGLAPGSSSGARLPRL